MSTEPLLGRKSPGLTQLQRYRSHHWKFPEGSDKFLNAVGEGLEQKKIEKVSKVPQVPCEKACRVKTRSKDPRDSRDPTHPDLVARTVQMPGDQPGRSGKRVI